MLLNASFKVENLLVRCSVQELHHELISPPKMPIWQLEEDLGVTHTYRTRMVVKRLNISRNSFAFAFLHEDIRFSN